MEARLWLTFWLHVTELCFSVNCCWLPFPIDHFFIVDRRLDDALGLVLLTLHSR